MRIRFPLFAFLLFACGTADPSGVDEPLQIVGGQFVEGELPGLPPGSEGGDELPQVFAFGWNNPLVLPGQAEKGVEGRVSAEAAAVAIRLREMGSGYWVIPVGAEEPQYPGQRSFSMRASFPAGLPAGSHKIAVVAISPEGVAGVQLERELCVAGLIPDNLHGCDSSIPPPAMVVSLSWNVDADVDLQLITSSGRVVNPETPLLEPIGEGARPDPMAARIDRDSLESCVPDGLRRENFIIQERLPAGTTLSVHARLEDSCGYPSVAFRLEVHERRGEDGDYRVIETFSTSGVLTPYEEGDEVGLLLGRIHF